MIIDFRYVLLDFSVRVSLQSVSGNVGKSDLQKKWEKSNVTKGAYIYDNHTKDG